MNLLQQMYLYGQIQKRAEAGPGLGEMIGKAQGLMGTAMPYVAAAQGSLEGGAKSIQDFMYNPQSLSKDKSYLTDNIASTLASPLIDKALDASDQYLQPAHRGMIDNFRRMGGLRKSVVTSDNSLVRRMFNDVEEKWVNRNFQRQKAGVQGHIQGTYNQLAGEAQQRDSSSQTLQAAAQAAKSQFKVKGQVTSRGVAEDLLHRGFTTDQIKGARTHIDNIIADSNKKKGLTLIHKNLNLAKAKDSARRFMSKGQEEGARAAVYGQAAGKIGEMNARVQGMGNPLQASGPRFNIMKFIDNAKNIRAQQKAQDKEASIMDFLNASVSSPFDIGRGAGESAEENAPKAVGVVTRKRKGDLSEYMASLKEGIAADNKETEGDESPKAGIEDNLLGKYLKILAES